MRKYTSRFLYPEWKVQSHLGLELWGSVHTMAQVSKIKIRHTYKCNFHFCQRLQEFGEFGSIQSGLVSTEVNVLGEILVELVVIVLVFIANDIERRAYILLPEEIEERGWR